MVVVVTERARSNGRLITLSGTEQEVADELATGAHLSNTKYTWNSDCNRIVWDSGIVGAVSCSYLSPVK